MSSSVPWLRLAYSLTHTVGHTVGPIPDESDESDPVLGVGEVSFFECTAYLFVVDCSEVTRQRVTGHPGLEPGLSVRLTHVVTVGRRTRRDLVVAATPCWTSSRRCSIVNTSHAAQADKQESPADARDSKMAAVPRWSSAATLDIIEPEIAQFDPPTPKTLA